MPSATQMRARSLPKTCSASSRASAPRGNPPGYWAGCAEAMARCARAKTQKLEKHRAGVGRERGIKQVEAYAQPPENRNGYAGSAGRSDEFSLVPDTHDGIPPAAQIGARSASTTRNANLTSETRNATSAVTAHLARIGHRVKRPLSISGASFRQWYGGRTLLDPGFGYLGRIVVRKGWCRQDHHRRQHEGHRQGNLLEMPRGQDTN